MAVFHPTDFRGARGPMGLQARPNAFLAAGGPPRPAAFPPPRGQRPAPQQQPAGGNPIAGVSDAALARAARPAELGGAFLLQLRSVQNLQERRALLNQYAQALVQQGVYDSLEEVAAEDVSDAGIERRIAMAMGILQELQRRRGADGGGAAPDQATQRAIAEAKARRQGDYRAFLEEWGRRNRALRGARAAWTAYADANPIVEVSQGGVRLRPATSWRQWFNL